MKWSYRIATIAGTEVRIHATFLLLLLYFGVTGMSGGRGIAGAWDAVALVLAMFTCVLLHEFGHVTAAKFYGIRTPDITLLPIGGVARLERMPRKPAHEFVVAVCGPLVNVAIATVIALFLGAVGKMSLDFDLQSNGPFWVTLMQWNILMVAFNMVPAFPMDGGRVLRSLLGMFVDYGRATRWAAAVGQGIAMLVVLSMLVSGAFQPFLMLIAVFIFIAAGQEAAVVTQEEATEDLLVRDAMVTQFVSLRPTDLLRDVVTLLLAGSQHDFPVLDERGSVIGILSRKRLVSALAEFGPGHPAQLVIEPCAEGVGPLQPLSSAMEFLNASACPAVPVIDPVSGRLVGLLTSENIGEMLMIRAALAPRAAAAARSDSL